MPQIVRAGLLALIMSSPLSAQTSVGSLNAPEPSIEEKVALFEAAVDEKHGLAFADYVDLNYDGYPEGLYLLKTGCDGNLCPWQIYDYASGEPELISQSFGDDVRLISFDDGSGFLYVDGILHEYVDGRLALGQSYTSLGTEKLVSDIDLSILNSHPQFSNLERDDVYMVIVPLPISESNPETGRILEVAVINDIYYNQGPSRQTYVIIENEEIIDIGASSDIPRIYMNFKTGNPVIVDVSGRNYFYQELSNS